MTQTPLSSTEASAGHAGPDARSDCRVRVWRPEPGVAPEVIVRSKVAAMYGPAIRALLLATRTTLGADDLSIEIDDQGALPWTLMARIEAALHRLRPEASASAPSPALGPLPNRGHGLRRSRLYLPGDAPKFFINAGLHRPDAVILDLEDAVAPAEKDAARILVRNALRSVDYHGAERMVRVNALPAGLADISALAAHGVDVFVIPKVESAEAVATAQACIKQAGATSGLLATIETARGVMRATEIAAASGVVAMTLGLEDYAADNGATRSREERLGARAHPQRRPGGRRAAARIGLRRHRRRRRFCDLGARRAADGLRGRGLSASAPGRPRPPSLCADPRRGCPGRPDCRCLRRGACGRRGRDRGGRPNG
jgi:citrate lyase subunit beta/citryl-CoA lyase